MASESGSANRARLRLNLAPDNLPQNLNELHSLGQELQRQK